jgi:hypothetical protein
MSVIRIPDAIVNSVTLQNRRPESKKIGVVIVK